MIDFITPLILGILLGGGATFFYDLYLEWRYQRVYRAAMRNRFRNELNHEIFDREI